MTNTTDRLPWHNRYETPDEDALLAPIRAHENGSEQFELARAGLADDDLLAEHIGWHGVPWRWAFTYTVNDDHDLPVAYLVPDPEKPSLACCIPVDAADTIMTKKLHRSVKEGLGRAKLVGTNLWAEWELTPGIRVDDLTGLVATVAGHRSKG